MTEDEKATVANTTLRPIHRDRAHGDVHDDAFSTNIITRSFSSSNAKLFS